MLAHQHKDLSSDPSAHREGWAEACICTLSAPEVETGGSLELMVSQFSVSEVQSVRDSVFKYNVEGWGGGSVCRGAGVNTQTKQI